MSAPDGWRPARPWLIYRRRQHGCLLSGKSAFESALPKALLGVRLRAGRWGLELDRFGGWSQRGRLTQTWVRAPVGSACSLGAAERLPARELLLLKRRWEVLAPRQRKNLLRSPSPGAWTRARKRVGWVGGKERRDRAARRGFL